MDINQPGLKDLLASSGLSVKGLRTGINLEQQLICEGNKQWTGMRKSVEESPTFLCLCLRYKSGQWTGECKNACGKCRFGCAKSYRHQEGDIRRNFYEKCGSYEMQNILLSDNMVRKMKAQYSTSEDSQREYTVQYFLTTDFQCWWKDDLYLYRFIHSFRRKG